MASNYSSDEFENPENTEEFLDVLYEITQPTNEDIESTRHPSLRRKRSRVVIPDPDVPVPAHKDDGAVAGPSKSTFSSALTRNDQSSSSDSESNTEVVPSKSDESIDWHDWDFSKHEDQLYRIHMEQLEMEDKEEGAWTAEVEQAVEDVVNKVVTEGDILGVEVKLNSRKLYNSVVKYLCGLRQRKSQQMDKNRKIKKLVKRVVKKKKITKLPLPSAAEPFKYKPLPLPPIPIPMSKRTKVLNRGPLETNGFLTLATEISNSNNGPEPIDYLLAPGERSFTPLVRLTTITEKYGLDCELFAKCQYLRAMSGESFRIVADLLSCGSRVINNPIVDIPIITVRNVIEAKNHAFYALANRLQSPIFLVTDLRNEEHNEDLDYLTHTGSKFMFCQDFGAQINQDDDWLTISDKLVEARKSIFNINATENIRNIFRHAIKSFEEMVFQLHGKADALVCDTETAILFKTVIGKLRASGYHGCQLIPVEVSSCSAYKKELKNVRRITDAIPAEVAQITCDLLHNENILCPDAGGRLVLAAMTYGRYYKERKNKAARIVVFMPGCLTTGPENFNSYHCQPIIDENVTLTKSSMECVNYWWHDIPVITIELPLAAVVNLLTTVKEAVDRMNFLKTDYLALVYESELGVGGITTRQELAAHLLRFKRMYANTKYKKNIDVFKELPIERIYIGTANSFDTNIAMGFDSWSVNSVVTLFKQYNSIAILSDLKVNMVRKHLTKKTSYFRSVRLPNGETIYAVKVATPKLIQDQKYRILKEHMHDLRPFYGISALPNIHQLKTTSLMSRRRLP